MIILVKMMGSVISSMTEKIIPKISTNFFQAGQFWIISQQLESWIGFNNQWRVPNLEPFKDKIVLCLNIFLYILRSNFDLMNHSNRRFALIFEISNFCHELVKIWFLNRQKWQFFIWLSIYVFFNWNLSAFIIPLLHLTVASHFPSVIPKLVLLMA